MTVVLLQPFWNITLGNIFSTFTKANRFWGNISFRILRRCCLALSGCLKTLNLSQTPLINLEGLFETLPLCPLWIFFSSRPLLTLLIDLLEPLQLPLGLPVQSLLLSSIPHQAHQVPSFSFLIFTLISMVILLSVHDISTLFSMYSYHRHVKVWFKSGSKKFPYYYPTISLPDSVGCHFDLLLWSQKDHRMHHQTFLQNYFVNFTFCSTLEENNVFFPRHPTPPFSNGSSYKNICFSKAVSYWHIF